MQVTIRRVGLFSAIKIGFLLFGFIWLFFGLFMILGQALLLNAFMDVMRAAVDDPVAITELETQINSAGMGAFIIFYLVGFVANGIVGALVGFFYALVYNIIAWIFGGLKISLAELEGLQPEKAKMDYGQYAPQQQGYQQTYYQQRGQYTYPQQQYAQQQQPQGYGYQQAQQPPPQQQPAYSQQQTQPTPVQQPDSIGSSDQTPPRGMPPVNPDDENDDTEK